jgi:serine protease Do
MFRKISLILIIATVWSVGYAQQSTTPKESQPKSDIRSIPIGLLGGPSMEQIAEMERFNYLNNSGGYLGIEPVEITKQNMSKYGLSAVRGVAVEKVVENSPAQQSGVQNGDVIVAINGEEVSSIRKMMRIISEIAPDHQAKITILRNGEEREFTITLAKRPMPKFEEGTFRRMPMPMSDGQIMRFPGPNLPSSDGEILVRNSGNTVVYYNEDRQIGARVTKLTKQLGEHFGVSEGMLINEIIADSPAEKAGLKAGDVIAEIDGRQITNQLELTRALMAKKEGEVLLTIVRDKAKQNVKILPSIVKRNGKIIRDEITTRY